MSYTESFHAAVTLIFAAAGLASGIGYFALLRSSVVQFVSGQLRMRAAMLVLFRVGTATLLFTWAAHFGPLPLLAGFVGFLIARTLAIRRTRRAS